MWSIQSMALVMQRYEIQALENGMWSVIDRQTDSPLVDREGSTEKTSWKHRPGPISATAYWFLPQRSGFPPDSRRYVALGNCSLGSARGGNPSESFPPAYLSELHISSRDVISLIEQLLSTSRTIARCEGRVFTGPETGFHQIKRRGSYRPPSAGSVVTVRP